METNDEKPTAREWLADNWNDCYLSKPDVRLGVTNDGYRFYRVDLVYEWMEAYAAERTRQLEQDLRELAMVANSWLSTSECHHKDDSTCAARKSLHDCIMKALRMEAMKGGSR